MNNYFIEFEFKSNNSYYWFPLTLQQMEEIRAKEIYKDILDGLKTKYEVTVSTPPCLFVNGQTSANINKYVKDRFSGKAQTLHLSMWNITEAEFKETIKFYESSPTNNGGHVFKTIEGKEFVFPVAKLVSYTPTTDDSEFLIINVYNKVS
jgi:hypothetical protein